jgi:hypothetical protein
MRARLTFPVWAVARPTAVGVCQKGWRPAAPCPIRRAQSQWGACIIVQAARRRRRVPSQRWELTTEKGGPGLLSAASLSGLFSAAAATLEYLHFATAPPLAGVAFKPSGRPAAETPRDAVPHLLANARGADTPAGYPPAWVWSLLRALRGSLTNLQSRNEIGRC